MAMTAAELIKADQDHLIHPLHHPIDNAEPIIYVRGRGAMVAGHRRPRDDRRPLRPVERQRRPRPHRAGRRGGGPDEGDRLLLRLRRLLQHSGHRAGRPSWSSSPTTCRASSSRPAAPRPTSRRSRPRASTGRPRASRTRSRSSRASNAYHGVTLQAMSATGMAAYWKMFEPRVPGLRAHPDLLSVPRAGRQAGRDGGPDRRAPAGRGDHPRGRGHGGGVHRRADPRRRRRALSDRRLLPARAPGLRSARGAVHRRRGHHRLLPDGQVVRAPATGTSSPTSARSPRA